MIHNYCFYKNTIINKHNKNCLHLSFNNNYYRHEEFCFMITIRYQRDCLSGDVYNKIQIRNKQFLKAHKSISHQIINGNVSRQKYKQPFCIVFGDSAGTKSGRSRPEDQIGNGFHHHGIMLIHPDTIDAFKSMTSDTLNQISRNTTGVASIDIRPIDDGKPLDYVINYSAKFEKRYRNNPQYGDLLSFIAPEFADGEITKFVMTH